LLAPANAESNAADNQQQAAAAASQQYFKSVSSILDDVRTESGDAKTFGENALWFDKWARKIDKLPVLRVDQDLVGFGQYASTQLRNMAAALRGMTITSAAREAQVYNTGSSYGSYDGWGGYSYYNEWRNVDGQRRAIRAQERAKGASTARNIAREIETETGKVRQAMTQKYQVEF
jgi:hypothetical protein